MRRDFYENVLPFAPGKRTNAPLICFVHVPKAAGTSINRHLRNWSWRGLEHVERFHNQNRNVAQRVEKCDWISGHLSYENWLGFLAQDAPDRTPRLFGVIRDPVAHVAAHYNWQIEIFSKGRKFYDSHPQAIHAVSEKIRSTDHTDPAQVISALSFSPALFANLQSRFLLGNEIPLDGAKADARFQTYEAIRSTADLPDLIKTMTGSQPQRMHVSNASTWHFDRVIFSDPKVLAFLNEFNSHDVALFGKVTAET